MSEQWLPVVGYAGLYEVSDQGRVRSVGHWANSKPGVRKLIRGRVLRLNPAHRGGYLLVTLSKQGKKHHCMVSHLVAEAFIGPRPEGLNVLHGPLGNKVNTVSNLSYGTQIKNTGEDRRRDGTMPRARAKLTEEQVREVRRTGGDQKALAARFGVTPGTISHIIRRKTWTHI